MDLSRVKRAQDNGDYYLIEHADHGAIIVPKSKLTPEGDAVVQQMCNGGLAGYDGDEAEENPSSQVVPSDAGRREAENAHDPDAAAAADSAALDTETAKMGDAARGSDVYQPPAAAPPSAPITIQHGGTTITLGALGTATPAIPPNQIEDAVPQVSPEEPVPGKPVLGFNPLTAIANQFAPSATSGEPAPALQTTPAPALAGPTTPAAPPPEKLPVGPPAPPTLVPNQNGINQPGNFNFDENALTKKSGLAQEQGVIEEQARRDLKTQNDYLTLQKALISGREATLAGFDRKQTELNALAAKPIQPFQLFGDVPFTNSDGSPMLDSEGKQRHGVQWQNVLGAIGLALGTFGAAWSKTPNYAAKVYQDAIDNDLKVQEQNQANARQLANMNVQQRQQYLQEYDLRKIDATDRVSALLKGSAAQAAGPIAAARLQQQAADIDALNAQNKLNYADKQMALRASALDFQTKVLQLTAPTGTIAMQNATNEGFGIPDRYVYNPTTQKIDQYKVPVQAAQPVTPQNAPEREFFQPVDPRTNAAFTGQGGITRYASVVAKPVDKTLSTFQVPVLNGNGIPQLEGENGRIQFGPIRPIVFASEKLRDEAGEKLNVLRDIGNPITGLAAIMAASPSGSIKAELRGRFDELVKQYNQRVGKEAVGSSRVGSEASGSDLSLPYFNPIKGSYKEGELKAIVENYVNSYKNIIASSDGYYDKDTRTVFH